MTDDAELLRRYAEERDEASFAEIVRRHVNLVHSAAVRQVNGDAHLAADITQAVFTDLARKAGVIARHRVLAAWLFTSTRYAAAKAVRTERRRAAREQEAQLMQDTSQDSAASLDWGRVRPVLDAALGELNERDREAILLRYFEGRDYAELGARLSVSDNTARMRVERALDKLRAGLERRGLPSTSAALGLALGAQAVAAAPAGLAATVTGAALGGAGAGSATAAVIFMSMTKLQLGSAAALLALATTGYVIQRNTLVAMQRETATFRAQAGELGALQRENAALARTAAEVEDLRKDDAALAQLRDEATAVRARQDKQAAAARAARSLPVDTSGEIFDLATLDRPPASKFSSRPQYPAALRAQGIEGHVTLEFIVDSNGNVANAHAVASSRPEFEGPAIEAISKWRFEAGQKGGRQVNARMQIPIVFTLSTEKPGTAMITWPPPSLVGADGKKTRVATPDWF
jgi:RNA polymerase sigma factor (sigma-70 family)